jgi:hypothetical protein
LARPGPALDHRADPPVVAACRTADGTQLAVWCAHCQRPHFHGAVGPSWGAGDGHRHGHCADRRSPFRLSGYYLRETSRVVWIAMEKSAIASEPLPDESKK